MLTPQQLLSARSWLGVYYAAEDTSRARASRLPGDDPRKTCREALVVCEKVMALFEHWKTSVPAATGPEAATVMDAWAQRLEDLERLLQGGD